MKKGVRRREDVGCGKMIKHGMWGGITSSHLIVLHPTGWVEMYLSRYLDYRKFNVTDRW